MKVMQMIRPLNFLPGLQLLLCFILPLLKPFKVEKTPARHIRDAYPKLWPKHNTKGKYTVMNPRNKLLSNK
jgi:hypothetical protein